LLAGFICLEIHTAKRTVKIRVEKNFILSKNLSQNDLKEIILIHLTVPIIPQLLMVCVMNCFQKFVILLMKSLSFLLTINFCSPFLCLSLQILSPCITLFSVFYLLFPQGLFFVIAFTRSNSSHLLFHTTNYFPSCYILIGSDFLFETHQTLQMPLIHCVSPIMCLNQWIFEKCFDTIGICMVFFIRLCPFGYYHYESVYEPIEYWLSLVYHR
jgi:hypothetical protein